MTTWQVQTSFTGAEAFTNCSPSVRINKIDYNKGYLREVYG